MAINTDYGLRVPTFDEILEVFGSYSECARITGGDVPTILFYINNPDRIHSDAPTVSPITTEFSKKLIVWAQVEEAREAWDNMPKPSITSVADDMGVCRKVARRALVAAGKWPKPKVDKAPKLRRAVSA